MNYACYWIFRHGVKAKELDYFLQEKKREIMGVILANRKGRLQFLLLSAFLFFYDFTTVERW
jgi:hypothetical protein